MKMRIRRRPEVAPVRPNVPPNPSGPACFWSERVPEISKTPVFLAIPGAKRSTFAEAYSDLWQYPMTQPWQAKAKGVNARRRQWREMVGGRRKADMASPVRMGGGFVGGLVFGWVFGLVALLEFPQATFAPLIGSVIMAAVGLYIGYALGGQPITTRA